MVLFRQDFRHNFLQEFFSIESDPCFLSLTPFQIVKMLADAKFDVSMKDCNGMTAADVADKAKETDIINFLKVNRIHSLFKPNTVFILVFI